MSRLLAVDIGNTNIKFGLWYENQWEHIWRAQTITERTADEYATFLRGFLQNAALDFADIGGVIIASVVPTLTLAFSDLARRYVGIAPLVVNSSVNIGLRIDVDFPDQVGADRIVNAAAAYHLYGGPVVVVDLGTASKFEAITTDGRFIGGSIAPGIGGVMDTLTTRTAKLFRVAFEPPPSPVGRNTTHALQSGLFWGYVGLVEGLITRVKASLPSGEKAKVVATGGYAALLREHIPAIHEVAPQLTLDGLRIIAALNP